MTGTWQWTEDEYVEFVTRFELLATAGDFVDSVSLAISDAAIYPMADENGEIATMLVLFRSGIRYHAYTLPASFASDAIASLLEHGDTASIRASAQRLLDLADRIDTTNRNGDH